MCGLAGIIKLDTSDKSDYSNLMNKFCDVLKHRGPDSKGIWMDQYIGLCHTRLSILDLSKSGAQPMISESERYIIAFNGEIYNHLEIRNQIEKNYQSFSWKGMSDTETVLKSIEVFGFEASLKKFTGMFSIAIWDRQKKEVYLARDRLGEKPLYFGFSNNEFIFTSELKTLDYYPSFKKEISMDAAKRYFKFGYVPSPLSIYKNIYKLTPGTFIKANLNQIRDRELKPKEYWSIESAARDGLNNQIDNIQEIETTFQHLLKESVNSQMISDVPIGCFLSGGIDSSLITSVMQECSSGPVKTFTIGFEEPEFDESKDAAMIANHLGTEHTELIVTSNDSMDVIPNLPNMYDEPFSDSSAIPTYLVSKLAKSKVTVSLSGDGGDELFGGYNRYLYTHRFWNKISFLPFHVRKSISAIVGLLPINLLSNLLKFSSKDNFQSLIEKIYKTGKRLDSVRNIDDLYLSLVSDPYIDNSFIKNYENNSNNFYDHFPSTNDLKGLGFSVGYDRMMFLDQLTYLPDDILCKVDRAAMSNSLETRAPFLDKNLVEFSWKIPSKFKIHNNKTKFILRNTLNNYIPNHLIERPKSGFGIPLGDWLRGPLNQWANDLLSSQKIKNQGIIDFDHISYYWDQHQKRDFDWGSKIWTILMFQAWLEEKF